MSQLFDISWTERSFLLVFCLRRALSLRLDRDWPLLSDALAGFLAWFIFIGPGVAEFTHFIFPLLKPALDPTLPTAITDSVKRAPGRRDAELLDRQTGRHHFPGPARPHSR